MPGCTGLKVESWLPYGLRPMASKWAYLPSACCPITISLETTSPPLRKNPGQKLQPHYRHGKRHNLFQ
uniref:Uncharacterized protein n=1 Tax=Anguilla anguilla TaxID=7936 RepID=A0A0E9TB58_ANGAN